MFVVTDSGNEYFTPRRSCTMRVTWWLGHFRCCGKNEWCYIPRPEVRVLMIIWRSIR